MWLFRTITVSLLSLELTVSLRWGALRSYYMVTSIIMMTEKRESYCVKGSQPSHLNV